MATIQHYVTATSVKKEMIMTYSITLCLRGKLSAATLSDLDIC